MKKVFMLVLSLTLSVATFSQVVKYKTIETKVNNDEWTKQDILVTCDIANSKLKIFAETESDIDLISYQKEIDDGDGKTYYFKGVDEDGIRCNVIIKKFDDDSDGHVITIILIYKNARIAYRLKND